MEQPISCAEIEKEIAEKRLTAPRITLERIADLIKEVQYYVFPGTYLTVCCITLENRYPVIGKSVCVSPANFNAELGRKIAYGKAVDEIGALEGYLLKQRLAEGEL